MKTCKKFKDSDLLIPLGAEYHSAPNGKYHDAEFFEWTKSKFPEGIRFSIRRILAKRNRLKKHNNSNFNTDDN